MKTFNELIQQMKETNVVSSGAIEGLGYNVGKPDQPQVAGRDADDILVKKKKKRRRLSEDMETFAGCPVFSLNSDEYQSCMRGRERYERWNKKLNMEDMDNQGIRTYVHKNPGQPIVIKDSTTGIMAYLIPPPSKG